jgi:diaminopimelate decarboxylase
MVGIECKADRSKKPTRLQVDCMRKIEQAGGKCFVVYDDETLEEAIEYIKEAMKCL